MRMSATADMRKGGRAPHRLCVTPHSRVQDRCVALDCFAPLAMTVERLARFFMQARVILVAQGMRAFKQRKDTGAGQPILIFLCRSPGASCAAISDLIASRASTGTLPGSCISSR